MIEFTQKIDLALPLRNKDTGEEHRAELRSFMFGDLELLERSIEKKGNSKQAETSIRSIFKKPSADWILKNVPLQYYEQILAEARRLIEGQKKILPSNKVAPDFVQNGALPV